MKIKNIIKKYTGRLFDKTREFKRNIDLKRLENHANEIDMALTLYDRKSYDETMMVKGFRRTYGETIVRKTHAEDVAKIAREMAEKLRMNGQIAEIMGKHHDLGHTFLGHSGEWWISNIQENDGLGNVYHNAVGARELVYTEHIYDKILDKIKNYNPKISEKELRRIKSSLWLIIDGILSHNGETAQKQYIPDLEKTEEDFELDMLRCYSKEGYDRKIQAATPEASLMRLADQIVYTPFDMIDGLREGLVRDKEGKIVDTLDDEYIELLTEIGISMADIEKANKNKDFVEIAEKVKDIFAKDTIANSTKSVITMSPKMATLMNRLRNLNNQKAVNNVILKEDQEIYPQAIRKLRDKYAEIFMHENLDEVIKQEMQSDYWSTQKKAQFDETSISEDTEPYSENDEKFIRYVLKSDARDLKFTEDSVKMALRESIREELDIARDHALNQKPYKDKEELGLDYTDKNARIKAYIAYYIGQVNKGNMVGYNEQSREVDMETIYSGLIAGNLLKHCKDMKTRVADVMAGKYIASLNDFEFLQLLQDEQLISPKQVKSLTRKYKDIENLQDEVYIQDNWKSIAKAQETSTEIQGEVK